MRGNKEFIKNKMLIKDKNSIRLCTIREIYVWQVEMHRISREDTLVKHTTQDQDPLEWMRTATQPHFNWIHPSKMIISIRNLIQLL